MDALLKSEPARARLADIWKRRAVGEHGATARFAAYADRMKLLQIPQGFQDQTMQSSQQEQHHREVCLDVAHRLGAGEIALEANDFTLHQPFGPANMLADVVAFCCFAETINVPQLSTALHHITDPTLERATRDILADEVKHSRLGWAYLTWARQQGEGALLEQHLVHMLHSAAPAEILLDSPAHREQALLLEMGDPPMSMRRDILLHTLSDVIFPGLEAHGISTVAAKEWLANPSWPTRPPPKVAQALE